MPNYYFHPFPRSRIATFDVYAVGKQKHHISVLLECDVTDARQQLKAWKNQGRKVTFTSWLLKVIADTVGQHPEVAAFLHDKRKLIVFDDVNISLIVEKEVEGKKVPIPLVIEKAQKKSMEEIAAEIEQAKRARLSGKDIVLKRKTGFFESLYYHLPGSFRRMVWRYLLRHPRTAYRQMGNVGVTSVGMMGQVNGWFVHSSVHPLCFGIGSIIKKPVVKDDAIVAREVLNLTMLIDHDVIDGAPMARFVGELVKKVEG
ncbi:MAG: 2-oxo acid dehydrogenase subunit E2 [Saprospirales bacterium]|nr:2-oxo acid dehydrogenase subunit E2 [Saprospirales bacterium]MBK8489723.1 2-oxo acid dehydrogenase subunit E2 [Saprospirales bacterium]